MSRDPDSTRLNSPWYVQFLFGVELHDGLDQKVRVGRRIDRGHRGRPVAVGGLGFGDPRAERAARVLDVEPLPR
eukprot:1183163-Pyramimonas_sp.AAC.1